MAGAAWQLFTANKPINDLLIKNCKLIENCINNNNRSNIPELLSYLMYYVLDGLLVDVSVVSIAGEFGGQ